MGTALVHHTDPAATTVLPPLPVEKLVDTATRVIATRVIARRVESRVDSR